MSDELPVDCPKEDEERNKNINPASDENEDSDEDDEDDEDEEDEDEEDGDGSGRKGKSGGGKKPFKVKPEDLEALIHEEYSDEAWLEKVKALALGPFSTIIPGASAFDAESDLKKKLLIGHAGVLTKQIEPNDMADPELIRKLEARLNLRQEEMRAFAQSITPDTIKMAAIVGTALGVQDKTDASGIETKPSARQIDSVKVEKIETEQESNRKQDFEDDEYGEKTKSGYASKELKEELESDAIEVKKDPFAVSINMIIERDEDLIDPMLEQLLNQDKDDKHSFASQMDDTVNTGKPATKPTGNIDLGEQFNRVASELTAPVQTMKITQDAQFKLTDPASNFRPDPDKFFI